MNNGKIKEWGKYLILILSFTWAFNIVKQVLPPRGIIGISLYNGANCKAEIVNLLENMPAITSGMQLSDCIVKVEDEDVSDKNYNYVVSKIKGKPNTNVNVTVKRKDEIVKNDTDIMFRNL